LEFDDQDIIAIASSLANPFGVGVELAAEPGAIFERVALESGQKILPFLTKLAKQRNLIISSTSTGKLLFQRSTTTGNPVAILEQGQPPLLSVVPTFTPQQYYSHITGIEPAILGLEGSQYTAPNDKLQGVIRPYTYTIPDTLDADIKAAVDAKIGRMFGNVVAYSANVATWRDSSGNLWRPNTNIQLLAPSAMIYTSYEFTIRDITLNKNASKEDITLNLIFTGSLAGETPAVLPWEE
jgi:prophage tail gpP-like protein